ncbi:MAG: LpxI family protein [Halanaerobiaceae bacterium]
MSTVGVIAGKGKLPVLWTRRAAEKGHRVFVFALAEEPTEELFPGAEDVFSVNINQFGELLTRLEKTNVKDVVMMGKVEKKRLFTGEQPDACLQEILAGLEELSDENILLGLAHRLEKSGFTVLEQTTYLEDLLPEPGVLTSVLPEEKLMADMEFGFEMAREIGRLDIGQTVVVKDRVVLAVEAIEGTDLAIARGGNLGEGGITVAKVSRPGQDFRFDVPAVGPDTLSVLKKYGANGLVLEAGKTFILEKERFISAAAEAGIAVVALEG